MLIEREHFPRQYALLRRRHAIGRIARLRACKRGFERLSCGQRHAAGRCEVLLFFEHRVLAQPQKAARRLVEQPRVSRAHLNVQRAQACLQRRGIGQTLGISDRDEVQLSHAVLAREPLGAGNEVLCGHSARPVRLRQGDGIGQKVGVRVAKGGQHRRSAQIDDLVIGRLREDELPVPDAELLPALPARKGQRAVFVQRFHAPSIARGAKV